MDKVLTTNKNQIAADLKHWKNIEDRLSSRYDDVLNSRDFIKAKRDVYRYIQDKYKRKQLNTYEKVEMRLLRGQQRKMLRQMYPNPLIRLIRNVLVLVGTALLIAGKSVIQAVKGTFSTPANINIDHPSPYYADGQTKTYARDKKTGQFKKRNSSPTKNTKESSKKSTSEQKQQKNGAEGEKKVVVRKLNPKQRKQAPPSQAKTMSL